MIFQKASISEFEYIKDFYWHLIDEMEEQNDKIGWKKGICQTDEFLKNSLSNGELFTLKKGTCLCACVILNCVSNEGYEGVPWSLDCRREEVLIPHALAVAPKLQGEGIGKKIVEEILQCARSQRKKAVRLDILGKNAVAEKLYTKCGFKFVQAKPMFYEDTGWTEYKTYCMDKISHSDKPHCIAASGTCGLYRNPMLCERLAGRTRISLKQTIDCFYIRFPTIM